MPPEPSLESRITETENSDNSFSQAQSSVARSPTWISSTYTAWKPYIADTISAICFSVVVGGAIEACSPMTWDEILKSRETMFCVNLGLGRLYGKYRGLVFRAMGTKKQHGLYEILKTEAMANVSFWMPLYAASQCLSVQAKEGHGVYATIGMTAFAMVSALPYGKWRDFVFGRFGLPTPLDPALK